MARDLLGCLLVAQRHGARVGGVIVETEAYLGAHDPGSHAATRGMTQRNRVMYGPAGTLYVYVSYGIHHLLNIVCGPDGEAGAVLIRALEPAEGLETMRARRGSVTDRDLCRGPGRLTQALGVDLQDNDTLLGTRGLWVYDAVRLGEEQVARSGRIGLSAGHEEELRFYVIGSGHVSSGTPGPVRRACAKDRGEVACD